MAKKPKSETVFIGNKNVEIVAVSLEKLTEAIFLLIPYVKLIKTIKSELTNNSTDLALFYDIVQNLVDQINRDHLNKILAIFTGLSVDEIKDASGTDIVRILPTIIYMNDLYIVYNIFKQLEAFE